MVSRAVIWDLDDDLNGNAHHCAEHGVTREEVEDVLRSPEDFDVSRSSGYPVVFGTTRSGRHLMVVYEMVEAETVYPITAYEVPRRHES